MKQDPDATEIGALFRKGRDAVSGNAPKPPAPEILSPESPPRVTPIRLFSGKLSGSRNGKPSREENLNRSIDATICHWCDQKFQPGQMRYPMLDSICGFKWGLVSICLECFKAEGCGSCSDRRR
jgi:hypothetical protein